MRRVAAAAVVPFLVLVVLSGCSSEDAPAVATADRGAANGSPPASQSSAARAAELEKGIRWARCMTENGVETKDPVDGGGGIPFWPADQSTENGAGRPFVTRTTEEKIEALVKVQRACQQYRPSYTFTQVEAGSQEIYRKYGMCMREHGLADYPVPDDRGMMAGPPPNWDLGDGTESNPMSAEEKAAWLKCRHIFGNTDDTPPPDAPN